MLSMNIDRLTACKIALAVAPILTNRLCTYVVVISTIVAPSAPMQYGKSRDKL